MEAALAPAGLAPLRAAAAALFPHGVAVAAADPAAPAPALLGPEQAAMARARPARRREFAAGRAAARAAMAALGHAPAPVPMAPDRAPLWPAGLTGSLSHGAGACLAALAPAGALLSLGLDLEEDAALEAALVAEICRPAERAWLATQAPERRGRLARLIFSAKECAYKAQYPLTGEMLEFTDLLIQPDTRGGRFEAVFTRAAGPIPAGSALAGRYATPPGRIVTAIALRH